MKALKELPIKLSKDTEKHIKANLKATKRMYKAAAELSTTVDFCFSRLIYIVACITILSPILSIWQTGEYMQKVFFTFFLSGLAIAGIRYLTLKYIEYDVKMKHFRLYKEFTKINIKFTGELDDPFDRMAKAGEAFDTASKAAKAAAEKYNESLKKNGLTDEHDREIADVADLLRKGNPETNNPDHYLSFILGLLRTHLMINDIRFLIETYGPKLFWEFRNDIHDLALESDNLTELRSKIQLLTVEKKQDVNTDIAEANVKANWVKLICDDKEIGSDLAAVLIDDLLLTFNPSEVDELVCKLEPIAIVNNQVKIVDLYKKDFGVADIIAIISEEHENSKQQKK